MAKSEAVSQSDAMMQILILTMISVSTSNQDYLAINRPHTVVVVGAALYGRAATSHPGQLGRGASQQQKQT